MLRVTCAKPSSYQRSLGKDPAPCAAQRLAEDFGLVQGDWSSAPVPWILTFSTTCACGKILGSPRCMPESCDGTALGCDQSTRGTQLTVGKPQENSQWNIAMWTRVTRVMRLKPHCGDGAQRSQQVVLMHQQLEGTCGSFEATLEELNDSQRMMCNILYVICIHYSIL